MRGIGRIAVVIGTLAFVPTADATTFGTNLQRPANNAYTCSDFVGGAPTCSVRTINPYTGENSFPPTGTGVITQVRVKVGPITGPMQIVVEEALRQDNPGDPGHPTYACCRAVDASPVFTPKANSITAVEVNLPIQQDATPNGNGVYVDQHLALSVLAPNVPIPASGDPDASVGLWFPAWDVGVERTDVYGTAGADALFDADWHSTGAGFSGGAPVTLAGKSATVEDGVAAVKLSCNAQKPCKGALTLANQKEVLAPPPESDTSPEFTRIPATKRAKTYGKGSFKIDAHETAVVETKLKGPGKSLLDDRAKAKVWGNVTLKGSTAIAASFELKLKR